MDIKNKLTQGLKHTFDAVIPGADIEGHTQAKLLEKGASLTLPGFRKGKAPMTMLKQRYGDQVMGDVVQTAINTMIDGYVKEAAFKLAGTPDATIMSYDPDKGLEVSVTIHLLPELALPAYENMPLTKLVANDVESRLPEVLKLLGDRHATPQSLTAPRKAELKDLVTIDFEGFLNDVAFPGGKAENFDLTLGSGSLIPGFEEQIVGKNKGDTFDIQVTFPSDYHSKDLAGQKTTFKITLKDICTLAAAEGDVLAEEMGLEDAAALRNAILEKLTAEAEGESRSHMKRQILSYIAEHVISDVPENMRQQELTNIWDEYQKMRHEDPTLELLERDAFDVQHTALANRRILLGLALAEIGGKMGVRVENDEIRQAAANYVSNFGQEAQKLYDDIMSNRGAIMALQATIFEEKAIDALIAKATITEKPSTLAHIKEAIQDLEEAAAALVEGPAATQKKGADNDQKAVTKKAKKGN